VHLIKQQREQTFKYLRNWIGFFILGTINNLAYVIVLSAAKSLADYFNASNLIGFIPWANVGFGFVARAINTFILNDLNYVIRIVTNGLLMTVGLILLTFSIYVNFWASIVAIIVIGSSSSYGESVVLGYLRGYESDLVGAWSSGTGMAGVVGSLLYLGFVAINIPLVDRFLIPSSIIYLAAFFFLMTPPTKPITFATTENSNEIINEEGKSLVENDTKTIIKHTETRMQRYWRCFLIVAWRSLNLMLVYFFEYVISPGAAAKANSSNLIFVILSFCYQAGVLVSRSSLRFIKITRVEIVTVLQAINFVLWILEAKYHFINVWVQYPLMVYVGLLGGASYVNVFYLLLHDQSIQEHDKELCINIAAFAITTGITAAALFTLLMDNTFL